MSTVNFKIIFVKKQKREIVCVAVYACSRQTCQASAGEYSFPFKDCKFVVKFFSSVAP